MQLLFLTQILLWCDGILLRRHFDFYLLLSAVRLASDTVRTNGNDAFARRMWCSGVNYGGLNMSRFVTRFVKDESGATAIEYGLIAASIAVVIITAVQLLGTKLTTTFTSVAGAL